MEGVAAAENQNKTSSIDFYAATLTRDIDWLKSTTGYWDHPRG